mgnify:CR=1 FL=1
MLTCLGLGTGYVLILVLLIGSGLFLLLVELKKRGVFVNKARKLDLAIVGLTQQIRRNPNDAQAHMKRGIARFRKKDTKGALEDLARAIEIDDLLVEAHYHYGIINESAGNLGVAEKEYNWIREHSEDPYYKTAIVQRLKNLRAAKR